MKNIVFIWSCAVKSDTVKSDERQRKRDWGSNPQIRFAVNIVVWVTVLARKQHPPRSSVSKKGFAFSDLPNQGNGNIDG